MYDIISMLKGKKNSKIQKKKNQITELISNLTNQMITFQNKLTYITKITMFLSRKYFLRTLKTKPKVN